MYEPFYLAFDAYPTVVPRVKVRGLMALFLAVSILWALIWLLYRAWQVCQTPNDVLVEKLGLDIPPPPEVTLEEITAREIRLAWKQPEFHNSIHKHIIQVNNVKVGESKRAETAVEISNLAPGSIYHICVLSVSAANFQTPSAILHVRTKSLPLSQGQQDTASGGPVVRASIPRSTVGLPTPSAPLMSRELSSGQVPGKRPSTGRKSSPATGAADYSYGQVDDSRRQGHRSNRDESLEQLAERLKSLQQENDNVEKQAAEEDEEHAQQLKELEKQRDDLKKRVKEKDEASGDLKKHVSKLESVNRTVQSEKTKRMRLLQQKEAERDKRKSDIMRWQEKVARMNSDAAQVKEDKSRVEKDGKARREEIRKKIAKEQADMKIIDDEIQDKGGRIKKLEDERKGLQDGESEDGKELDRIDNERARQWEMKLNSLHARYATLVNLHTQAQQQYQEAQERLKWLTNQRPNSSGVFTMPSLDLDVNNAATIRPRRHRSSLNSNVSSPVNFPGIDTAFPGGLAYNPASTNSPTFPPSSAFFNINNGMTLPDLSEPPEIMRSDGELTFNNPQMSPRADALLPSDLLGDEESPEFPRPLTRPLFSAIEDPPASRENFHVRPASPASSGSRPGSAFASPLESLNRQASDPQAVGLSAAAERPKSATRRLSGLFGFHRPRGKTLADEPPMLGTLKPGQSHSFPRNLEEMDPIGSRRRRSSYTGNWANPMSLFPRSNTTGATADSSSDHPPSRRAAFTSIFSSSRFGFGSAANRGNSDMNTGYNQFSPRHDPIDPSSILGNVRRGSLSPRPSSTFSHDNQNQLPHPSTDNRHFGWPSTEQPGHRNSPLGLDWASPSTWSRGPTRRPSLSYGSSGHLPLGLTGEPDYLEEAYERQLRPLQAPIGTRPSSSHRPMTPKLNPTAPTFTAVFSGQKDGQHEEDEIDAPFDLHVGGDGSPSESRISRESRSLSHFTAESYDSLERIPSGASAENTSKESFIRKITRKGSSSKFSSWKDRSGLFSMSKKAESSQGDIDEDTASEVQLGKSVDSTISSAPSADRSTRSSLGFFSRKSRKSDKASETSERASEAGDEDSSHAEIPHV
ncbi:Fibronectin, type III domain-containing protein [Penicillium ucsense]|uniref:Fibronectin, type III domain-containing protein n=1 Tax=Penicillium ucsense TaxID=2839758 RepID=A0A8J8W5S7_9EURO|nr:Fibronectin, type III domain-containing protein [Penicillium ucsense]KAF7737347.1 Fibronectin, type III domain-containing protein [Penicillium ucsense]